jgi:hypothetical protein
VTRISAALLLAAFSGQASAADPAPAFCARLVSHVRQIARNPVSFRHALAVQQGLLDADLHVARRPNDPALAKRAFQQFLPEVPDTSVIELETSNGLWRVWVTGGTAECQDDAFFTKAADGRLVSVPSPRAELCWTSWRDLETVGGQTALVRFDGTNHPLEGMDVEIRPWTRGWQPPCRISLRYADRFRLSEAFCAHGTACRSSAALAMKLARALARDEHGHSLQSTAQVPPSLLRANADRLKTLQSQISDYGDGAAFPTFGRKANTEFPDYSYPTKTILVQVDGQLVAARVGIGGVGWRAIGDYLVVLYRLGSPKLEPVASYVVKRDVVGLQSATASIPASRRARN